MPAFDSQPILASPIVTLTPMVSEDWSELYAVASDPLIWAGHPASDRWQEAPFRAFFEGALASGAAFTIRDAQTGAILGSSRYNLRGQSEEVEIGWTFLARAAWGGRFNAQIKRLMIEHALKHFERVVFLIAADNLRSRRATEKLGATLSNRTEEASIGSKSLTHVVYVIDRDQFRQWEQSLNDPEKVH